VQDPHPPIWISARHPDVFRFAVDNRCHVMATPLHLRFDEVIALRERLDRAVADSGDGWQPQLMMLRNTGVYDSPARIPDYVTALIDHMRYFDTLFQNVGGVHRGFVDKADLARVSGKENYDEDALVTNHMFGTPEQVIEKLKMYEAAGVDTFMYGGTWGLSHPDELRSLELFISEVMPAFADARMDSPPGTAQTAALTP
jgi:alkanesulfonate monooxygenase SsuD/methylene tetrahydromethanopterin reductase-like flavin-dependent oxidoreductase (luciferase family)